MMDQVSPIHQHENHTSHSQDAPFPGAKLYPHPRQPEGHRHNRVQVKQRNSHNARKHQRIPSQRLTNVAMQQRQYTPRGAASRAGAPRDRVKRAPRQRQPCFHPRESRHRRTHRSPKPQQLGIGLPRLRITKTRVHVSAIAIQSPPQSRPGYRSAPDPAAATTSALPMQHVPQAAASNTIAATARPVVVPCAIAIPTTQPNSIHPSASTPPHAGNS